MQYGPLLVPSQRQANVQPHATTDVIVRAAASSIIDRWRVVPGGVFAQRAHSANYSGVYPGNTPANHPPAEACMIHSKQRQGCRIQDPRTRGKHQTTRCTSTGLWGAEFRTLGPMATDGGKRPTFRTALGAPPEQPPSTTSIPGGLNGSQVNLHTLNPTDPTPMHLPSTEARGTHPCLSSTRAAVPVLNPRPATIARHKAVTSR